ncbi:MAG: Nuclease precursor [Verrucomicrobiota bacterium]
MRRLLKLLGWLTVGICACLVALLVVYGLSDRAGKIAIEHHVLNVIDGVREDGMTPDKVIGTLDKFADQTEVVKGDIVPAPEPDKEATAPYGEPADQRGLKLFVNKGYSVGYDDSLPSPRWSSYRVFPYQDVHLERPSSFKSDVRTTARVTTTEFVRSGYDRGHLSPNYAISVCYGEEAQKETFLLSNIVPQLHALNAGLWKDLEQRPSTPASGRTSSSASCAVTSSATARSGCRSAQSLPSPPRRRSGASLCPLLFGWSSRNTIRINVAFAPSPTLSRTKKRGATVNSRATS